MLLSDIVFLVNIPLQCSEDVPLLDQVVSTFALDVKELVVRLAVRICACATGIVGRYGEIFQFFTEDDDGLLGVQGILRRERVAGCSFEQDLLRLEEAWRGSATIEVFCGTFEECEDVLEAIWVKL